MKASYKSMQQKWLFSLLLLTAGTVGCKKFVEIPAPPNLVADANVYSNDATAIAVLTGIYTDMSKPFFGSGIGSLTGLGSISLLAGLSADELTLFSGVSAANYQAFYRNALAISGAESLGAEYWSPLYNYLYRCNAAIEGLSSSESNSLTPVIGQQLLGEAKFLRAFFYFYLVNLYGDVPLAISTDYKVNSQLHRTPVSQVYQQIIADLKDAQSLLSTDFLNATLLKTTTDRLRPTKWTATALLARAYLFSGNWAKAEEQATTLINQAALFSLTPLNDAFLKNSNEAIWQLQPVTMGHNTEDGWIFILPASGPSDIAGSSVYPAYLSPQLLNSFEAGDQRELNWIDSVTVDATTFYHPYKYKSATYDAPVSEFLMVLRLAEQYLIRAEARAQQGNITGAQSDLNAVRARAGLSPTTAGDKETLLAAILQERQVELFTEWGHRWLDLKRTNKIDTVMGIVTPQKANGSSWQSYQQLYPLPLQDLNRSPNLMQNTGY